MSISGYTFVLGNWRNDADAIRIVREQVLVTETGLAPEGLDMADESQAFHVLVFDGGGRPVGAARMQHDGRIDYVAVLRPWRRRTIGGALLSYLHHIAYVRGIEHLWCVPPASAQRFFQKNQFVAAPGDAPEPVEAGRKFARLVSKPGQRSSVH